MKLMFGQIPARRSQAAANWLHRVGSWTTTMLSGMVRRGGAGFGALGIHRWVPGLQNERVEKMHGGGVPGSAAQEASWPHFDAPLGHPLRHISPHLHIRPA